MAIAIFGLIFVIWFIAAFIHIFFYNNVDIAAIGILLYFVVGIIFIAFYSIKIIIEEIEKAIYLYSRNKHDKEYARYKKEVLDSKYCYMTFDEWKRKQENKR